MKTPAISLLAVLLLTAGCEKNEKPEEKKGSVAAVPKPEERLKPTASTPPEAVPEKPLPPELDALYVDIDALEKEAAPLLAKTETSADAPEIVKLEASCNQLIKRRAHLTSGLS